MKRCVKRIKWLICTSAGNSWSLFLAVCVYLSICMYVWVSYSVVHSLHSMLWCRRTRFFSSDMIRGGKKRERGERFRVRKKNQICTPWGNVWTTNCLEVTSRKRELRKEYGSHWLSKDVGEEWGESEGKKRTGASLVKSQRGVRGESKWGWNAAPLNGSWGAKSCSKRTSSAGEKDRWMQKYGQQHNLCLKGPGFSEILSMFSSPWHSVVEKRTNC